MEPEKPKSDKNENEKTPEAFPETKMMPSGWNLSSVLDTNPAGSEDGLPEQKDEENPLSEKDQDKMRFPEPRTTPKGWNITK